MARSSKPESNANQTAAKRAPARRTVRRARSAPETVAASEPVANDQAELSDVEPSVAEAPVPEPERIEASAVAVPKTELPAVAPSMPEPAQLVESVEPVPSGTGPGQPTLHALPGLLQGIGLRFWQDQLERAMATGRAFMMCRSPDAAIRLQIAYIQATLASGIEHAGQVARLSQDVVRDMRPSQPR
jgi:hypothetical protein